ncbi:MAG: hypothetical protein R3B47_17580 [Bacteroidia bacterium]
MRLLFIIACLLLAGACDQAADNQAASRAEKPVTDFVARPGLSSPFSADSLALLAKTVGKPLAFEENGIALVDDGFLYKIPMDSVISWLEKPSYFRNPEEKLKTWHRGEVQKLHV